MATHDEGANLVSHDSIARTGSKVQPLNRRRALRVLGSLAAAAAGAAALSAMRPEQATAATLLGSSSSSTPGVEGDNSSTGPGVLGDITGTTPTQIHVGVWGRSSSSAAAVEGDNSGSGPAVFGNNTDSTSGAFGAYGVKGKVGTNNFNAAVFGASDCTDGLGVSGLCLIGTGAVGVLGSTGDGVGVQGTTSSATQSAVLGSNSGAGPGVKGTSGTGIGVFGTSNSSSSNSPGVWGQNTGGGPAIVGFSPSGVGFTAVTVSGTGCFGGASGSGTGVFAYSGTSTALVAQSAGNGALAGYFSGPVYVTGSLTVLGAKSAAVKGADGSLRRMYSLESPESWFEDFGSGQLNGGTATMQLASDFAGVVHGDDYRVFLTPRGESKGWLYIGKQSPNGFTVQEAGGGTSSIAFDYRVVAKRKDIPGARLEHVNEPPVPDAPTFPTAPTPPPMPVTPRGHGPEA